MASFIDLLESFKAQVVQEVTAKIYRENEITAPKIVNLNDYCLYKKYEDIAKKYGISKCTVRNRAQEIMKQIGTGKRYSDAAIIDDGGIVLVNELVWADWLKYRKILLSENEYAKKYIPDFEPKKWLMYLGGTE